MLEANNLSPQPIYDALHRACNMARDGNCNEEWRQARLEAESRAADRARKAKSCAMLAPAAPGPARSNWSESELLAKSARALAVNIATENRRWGVIPDTRVSAGSA